MYQKLTLIGNLGGDPELKFTPSGQAVANFSVATSRRFTGSDGQTQEETTWFRVSTWGKLAETCSEYLGKGSKVLVEGRLNVDRESGGPRIWTDQNGNPRASFEVTALEVRFLSSSNRRSEDDGAYKDEAPDITEDTIPF